MFTYGTTKENCRAKDSVGRLTCKDAGRVGQNGVENVANGVVTTVGQRCVQVGGRQDSNNSVGHSSLGRGSIDVRALVRTLVGRSCGHEWRWGARDSVV